jgi:rubredoxin
MEAKKEPPPKVTKQEFVHQCKHCLSVYDETIGDEAVHAVAGTSFEQLPGDYTCSLCEAPKTDFMKIEKSKLGLQPV